MKGISSTSQLHFKGVTRLGGERKCFHTLIGPPVLKTFLNREWWRMFKDFPSFFSSLFYRAFLASLLSVQNTSCSGNSHMTAHQLWHAAAGPHLRLLLLHRLLEFEQGWVAAGWGIIYGVAIGGDQRHARILRGGFGISEGVCGAVTKVTVEQGVVQELGSSSLLFQLWQSLRALFRPGFLLGRLGGDNPTLTGRRCAAIGGRLRWHGCCRGD